MCVAIALVVTAKIVVNGWTATVHVDDQRTIEAVGIAKRRAPAQQITWDVTATAHAKDCTQALKRLGGAVSALRTFVADHGIKPDEIELIGASCDPDPNPTDSYALEALAPKPPQSYTASRKLTVRSADLARVVAAFRAAGSAPGLEDADITEPACTLRDPDPLRRELLAAARKDALGDAERMLATLGGARLGGLVATSNDVAFDPGASSTVPSCEQEIEVVATVHATYRIE